MKMKRTFGISEFSRDWYEHPSGIRIFRYSWN